MATNNINIPNGWSVKKLRGCLEIKHGKPQHNIEDKNGTYPILASGGEIGRTNSFLCNKPSVLIGRKGTIDKPQYMDIPFWTVDTLFYSLIKSGYLAKYIFYKFETINWNKYNEGSTIPSLSSSTIHSIKVLLPPLAEQEKIAEILSCWDEAIEKLSDLIEQKKLLKKGLMQKLLTGKTRLSGFTQPWKTIKLGEIGTFSSAGVDKKIEPGEDLVHLLNYMDVYRNTFLYSKDAAMVVSAPDAKIKQCDLKKGDIFFTPSSETMDDIAHSAVVMEDIDNGVYSYHIVRLRPKIPLDIVFSAYMCQTDGFYKQAYSLCCGSGQRYVLSQNDFRKIEVTIPSDIAEQKAIADILQSCDLEIEKLKNKLDLLKLEKKGLMQQLLTGKIRVKVNK